MSAWTNIRDVEGIKPGEYLVLYRTNPFNWIRQSAARYTYGTGWEVFDPDGRGILMAATVRYFAPYPAAPQDVLDEWARRDSESKKG